MIPKMMPNQQPVGMDHWQDRIVNTVFNFCSMVTMPVEMVLRPKHGTRYFSPLAIVMSTIMMLVFPTFFTLLFGEDVGFIGLSGFMELYFVGLLIHGIRKIYLMVHPEKEKNSYLPNDHLFFFDWLPNPTYWRIRIAYEPLFLVVLSITLQNLFFITEGAGNFLIFSAVFLIMKNYVHWYTRWEVLRGPEDMTSAGPIMADAINRQSQDVPETPHVARVISEDDHGKA
jgi:hypothetical protein